MIKKEKTTISYNLIRFRKKAMLTQEQVAEALGIKRSTYAYYELGTTPKIDVLSKLAAIYRVRVSELLDDGSKANVFCELSDDDKFSDTKFVQSFNELREEEKSVILALRTIAQDKSDEFNEEYKKLIEKFSK